jgi:hypothetical protein
LGLLRRAGLSDLETARAYAMTLDYVFNFAATEGSVTGQPEGLGAMRQAQDVTREMLSALPRDRFPHLAALAGPLTSFDDLDERFAFGVDAIICQIERLTWGAPSDRPVQRPAPTTRPPAGS